jgi:hypothetical protein
VTAPQYVIVHRRDTGRDASEQLFSVFPKEN